ncbi:MAG: NADH dehydrogenase ubiquinone Fe-S protein 4 [Sphingomonadaceae bacterium]|nr:NADH dehydrogenase ubiquinone Fe-S protein 4 [Sphingomonadaceae bacterium]
MNTARIFQRPKSSTQSGRARTDRWLLVFERADPLRHDPLTGWLGSADTQPQVQLWFPTCEAAVDYCRREGLAYELAPTPPHNLKMQAYADNFR